MTRSSRASVLWPDRRRHGLFQLLLAVGLTLSATHLEPFAGRALALMGSEARLADNTFGTLTLGAPSALSGSALGHNVDLSWSAGQNGTGYAVNGAANGTSSDCNGASLGLITTTADTSATDMGRYVPQGSWFCYQVQTTREAWTSTQNNPVAAVQLGFVASAVTMTNNGNSSACGGEQSGVAGELDCGDQVVIDFNQAVDPTTGPASGQTVCAHQASQTVWLGSSAVSGDCTASETVSVGTLSSGTVGGCDCRFSASNAWSNGNTRLTVTIGARISGDMYPTLTGPWTLAPTTDPARLLSASGSYHVCDNNDNGGNCLPIVS